MMLYYYSPSDYSDLYFYRNDNSGLSYADNNPCDQGLSYQCFSEATAAQCGQVRNICLLSWINNFIKNFVLTDLSIICPWRLVDLLNKIWWNSLICVFSGESNCDWGEIEWCANSENTNRCNVIVFF